MEEAIVMWLGEIEVLGQLGLWDGAHVTTFDDFNVVKDVVTGRVGGMALPAMFDLSEVLFDGTLLCVLGMKVLDGVRRDTLRGWSRVPKTRGLREGNFRKARDAFKGWFNRGRECAVSNRFFGGDFVEKMVEGDWRIGVGVLEDVFRCVDGMKPRKGGVGSASPDGRAEMPYFGKYCGAFGSGWERMVEEAEREREEEEKKKMERDDLFCSSERGGGGGRPEEMGGGGCVNLCGLGGADDIVPQSIMKVVAENTGDIVPSDEKRAGGLGVSRHVLSRQVENVLIDGNDLAPVVPHNVAQPQYVAQPHNVVLEGAEADRHYEEARRRNEAAVEEVEEEVKEVNVTIEEALGFEEEDDDEEEIEVAVPPSPFPVPTRDSVYTLKKWLHTKLNIKLRNPSLLYTAPYVTDEFASGLLLVRIAAGLMPGRTNTLSGIVASPQTAAAQKGNCRRAVAALVTGLRPGKAAKYVDATIRNCHAEIAEGDARAAVALLLALKKLL